VVVSSLVHQRRTLSRRWLGLECLELRLNCLTDAGKRGSVANLASSASSVYYICCSTQYVEVLTSTLDFWAQAAGDKGISVSWSVWLLCGSRREQSS